MRLPAFSALFGIHPWDVDRLTFGELETYITQLDAYERRQITEGG